MKNIKTFESFNYESINEGILTTTFLAWCGYKFASGLISDIKSRKKLPKDELKEIISDTIKTAIEEYPKYKSELKSIGEKITNDIESGECKSLKDLSELIKLIDIKRKE